MKKKSLILNFAWLLADKLFKSLGNFFINLQVITYLSLQDYGLLNYALAINLFSVAFITFFRELLVKEFAESESVGGVMHIFQGISLIRLSFLVLGGGILTFIFSENLAVWAILMSGLINFSDIPEAYWQAKGQMSKPIITRVLVFFVFSLLKINLLLNHATFASFCFLFLYESICNFLMSYAYFLFDIRVKVGNVISSLVIGVSIIKKSLPLLLNSIFTIAYMRIDQIVIKEKLGATALGAYSFTLNIAEMLQAVPFMLGIAVAPMIFGRTDLDKLRSEIFQMMKFLLVLGIMCVLGLLTVFPLISSKYNLQDTFVIMLIIVIGTYPTFVSYLAGKYLIHTGQMNHFLKRSFIASLLSLSFNYLFVTRFGLYASAVTYAISQWYIGYFSNYSLKDKSLFQIQSDAFLSLFKSETYLFFVRKCLDIKKQLLSKI